MCLSTTNICNSTLTNVPFHLSSLPPPISCCSNCLTAYYCSKECQKSAFKAHKNECELLSQYKKRLEDDRKKIEAKEQELIGTELSVTSESCAICLRAMTAEELPLFPIACGHLFCYHCSLAHSLELVETLADDKKKDELNDKDNKEEKVFVCPICNPGMTNSMLIPIFRRKALEFMRLGTICERGGNAVKSYVAQAREELEKTTADGYWKERNAQVTCIHLFTQSHIYFLMLNRKHDIFHQDPVIQQLVAELYELEGQYETAVQTGNIVLGTTFFLLIIPLLAYHFVYLQSRIQTTTYKDTASLELHISSTLSAALGAKEASGFVLECQSRTGLLVARCQMNLGLYPGKAEVITNIIYK